MHRFRTRAVAGLALAAGLGLSALALSPTPASAAGERPVAYINPDTGKATENGGVLLESECATPDQRDTMSLGDEATGMNNVHVDACLFNGSTRVDTQAAFDTTGVGVVTGCPDADMTGPKVATKSANRCLQGGYEQANKEYHVRVTSATAGLQTVRFCADPEGNGCADATGGVSTVRINWGVPSGAVDAGGSEGLPTAPVAVAVSALLAGLVATALVLRTRRS